MNKFNKVLFSLLLVASLLVGSAVGAVTATPGALAQIGAGNYDILSNVLLHGNVQLVDGADMTLNTNSDLVANGAATFAGAVTMNGAQTSSGLVGASRQSTVTVTTNGTIAVTGGYVPLTSAGNVATSSVTGCSAGPVTAVAPQVIFENVGSNTITLTDTATLKLSGNIALGQFDSLLLKCDTGSGNWIQLATANN